MREDVMETADALRAPVAVERVVMETAHATPASASTEKAAGCPMCHSSGSLSPAWLQKRRGWIIAGGAAVAGMGVALGEGWVTIAGLAPILYSLPCAVMMLFCMKGMSRGMQTTQEQSQTPVPPATGRDNLPEAKSRGSIADF
jgi:hypothetical protein